MVNIMAQLYNEIYALLSRDDVEAIFTSKDQDHILTRLKATDFPKYGSLEYTEKVDCPVNIVFTQHEDIVVGSNENIVVESTVERQRILESIVERGIEEDREMINERNDDWWKGLDRFLVIIMKRGMKNYLKAYINLQLKIVVNAILIP